MYSFPNLEPVYCSICNCNCSFLTCIQISQEAGQVVWYSHLWKNFPQFVVIHTDKGFGLVNKAEVDVFLELSSGLGNRLLEGTNKTLCVPGSRRMEQWPHKRLTQTCLGVSWSLQQRCGPVVACCRVWGTEGSSACMGPFEEGCHYLHYLHHSFASSQTTEREHSPAHQQKIGLKIYWAWPCPSKQDPVSPSVSFSPQEASISLLSLSIRGHKKWKPQLQKTNQTDHMDHSLV